MAVSTIKLSGMVSGLDTDKIIKQLMQVERSPLDKLNQQKTKLSWKREAYREVNTSLSSIQSLVDKLRFSNSFSKQAATSSDTSVVTATSSSSATSGGFSIKVNSLASSAMVVGTSKSVTTKEKVGSEGSFEVVGPKGSKTVNITADTTYDSVMRQVNGANIGVTMSYDSINGRFMMNSTATGENASIQINDAGGTASSLLGLSAPTAVKGTNASVELNGKAMTFDNNAFELNGVRFDLKGVSTSTVSVTVARDTSGITSQIKDFVEQYNNLVSSVTSKTKETVNRNYAPLTDEQREGMTEDQIKIWEKKAKAGTLYRDDILTDALSSLRSALTQKVSGLSSDMDSLSDIGITFKAYSKNSGTSELGKLELDETKLTEAINKDPEGVARLFTKTSALDSKDPNYQKESGYGDRLYTSLTTSINKIIKRIGASNIASDGADQSQLGKQIGDINNRMRTLEDRLKTIEDRYYKQFTAMEIALQKLNSQGSWLTSQLSG